ncbi:MFS transporter [Arthrobacter sp. MMS18-M83]|uniref:MFS transporter n=1 Tax=Arthrobacter sp. MMS18-M83 TaxID=2996261 RepID=UPI00227CDC05|nr:MFS transporter [Arthrobacter sp. MMS18-M83]WAH96311.1 MFS transporter [Arthrobacter sp. MMS18-M83]
MSITATADHESRLKIRQATRAGAIGNLIEFFDFSLYGFFAVMISKLFFPTISPVAALLATFAVYGGAFVMRPVGAIVFGHIADRVGRRRALMISVVLMSLSTALIGMLPGYAQIGVFAPALLLLCRLTQAFSAGGEQSNSYVLVIEHSPVKQRGRNGSWLVVSVMLGVVAGILLSLLMESVTSDAQMEAWGWRVPFIVAVPLGLLGLYLRIKLQDSDVFKDAHATIANEPRRHSPLVQALRTVPKEMLILFGWIALVSLAGYILIGFMVTLLVKFEGYDMSAALGILAVSFLIGIPAVLAICRWADHLPRKVFATANAVAMLLWTLPAFWLVGQGPIGAGIALTVWIIIMYPMNLVAGFAVVELFPVDIRASASGVPYQLGFAIFGGSAPYLATWLTSSLSSMSVAYYVAAVALIGILVAIFGIPNAREMAVVSTVDKSGLQFDDGNTLDDVPVP